MALALPVLWSFVELLIKSRHSKIAETSLSILLILLLFSLGEQIDILGYICWPGLILMGIAFKQKIKPVPYFL